MHWHAENVLIIRDTWGIAHVYGKTDADTVFGTIYAQAEDDFGRIERNYLNGLGMLAKSEGEAAMYSDLRQRLFVDPRRLRRDYGRSPAWLRTLMVAWSDGLNYYLSKHPRVTAPIVGTLFFPFEYATSAGGLDAYDTTIGRVPDPPPAVKSRS